MAADPLSALATRSEFFRSVLGLLAATGTFRAGAAVAVIGQPAMPKLTGTFQEIGVRYTRCGGARVKVFYPAVATTASTAAPYCTDGRATSDGMAGLVGFKQLGLSFLLAHLADAPSGCLLNAPPLSSMKQQPLPLLCYSHGFGGNMDMATYLMREIASHGVVVAAVEHTDGTASNTVLSDETELPFSPQIYTRREQLERRAAELLAAAEPGALGADLPLDGRSTFLGGHSYGGPSALLASSLPAASRCGVRGLVLHDPALGMNAGIDAAVGRRSGGRDDAEALPIVSYVSDEYDRAGVRCGRTYHTSGGFHGNFVDAPLWAPRWVMRPLSAVIPAAGPCDAAQLHAVLAESGSDFMRAVSSGSARAEEATAASPSFASSRLLELRGGASSSPSPSSSFSPTGALLQWRSSRLRAFAAELDGSRYHMQVLFVDDDGRRARTCEAMLERVAEWADAGWWIYPHSASIGLNVADGEAAPRSLLATSERLGLCQSRLGARAATIEASDLYSHDMIVATDYDVLEQLKELARRELDGGVEGVEAQLLCVTDFLAYDGGAAGDQRMDALDDELRSLLAPKYAEVARLTELPSVVPTETEAWEVLLAAVALSCSGLAVFLKDAIDAWFLAAYDELLCQLFSTRASVESIPWAEAEELLRSHIVTGGLDGKVRQQLFEEHRTRLLSGEQ